jgi:branched-chain amino acid transport system permease protein
VNWNLFVTELVSGIVHGCVYALIALGYSMVYGILKLLNFAHGDVFMVGSFIAYGILTVFGGALGLTIPIAVLLFLMFVGATLGGGLLGVAIERFAYRRLRDAPRVAPLITALGVSFFLENAALLIVGADYQSFNTYSWNNGSLWSDGFTLPSGYHVGLPQIIVVVGTIVLMILLTLFVSRTQLGRAMRAVSFDRQAAEMMGIDVNRVIAWTFFIGSGLAGAAAVFNGIVYQEIQAYMGFEAGLLAFVAAVIGGIGSLPGAVMGGLVIGLAQSFTVGYVSSTFSDAIVFAILIAVMLLRPNGLFGQPTLQKV